MSHARHARGRLVKILREGRRMTGPGLALAADIDPSYLWRIENEQRLRPSEEVTDRLAEALGVDVAYLTGQLPPYRVLRERPSRRLSLEQVARSARLSPEQLTDIEDGVTEPDDATLGLLAIRLGVLKKDLAEITRQPGP